MGNYSERQAQVARRIVERLLSREEDASDIEATIVVSDVESDAAEFAEELELLEDLGVDAPALRIGEDLVPVALSVVAGASWPFTSLVLGRQWRHHPFSYEWAHYYFRSLFKDQEQHRAFETLPREEARSTFVRRATDFLATRIAAVNGAEQLKSPLWPNVSFLNILQRAGGPRVVTPGCQFTISTTSAGLRVFWSGAYRVSPNYFGHPTTPAVGVLQSGTFIFGVDGGAYGSQIQWDHSAVTTLPGNPNLHLNY